MSESTTNNTGDLEKKLGELLLRGWIMLASSCPIESCQCPLMKNHDGQTYCVNCESWIFDKEKSGKKQRFGEIVAVNQNNQRVQLKEDPEHTQLSKVHTNPVFTIEKQVLTALNTKLVYLSSLLNNESDIYKIEQYLKLIKLLIEDIAAAKALYKLD